MKRRLWMIRVVCSMLLLTWGGVAQLDASERYDGPGSLYLGGTEGLTGFEAARGYADSVFYSRFWEAGIRTGIIPDDASKIIFGEDNRRDVYAETDPNMLKLAQACCIVVFRDYITDNGDDTYTLAHTHWNYDGEYPICEDEPFRGQLLIGGNCSGFLVAPDIIVTAGHCLSQLGCDSWAFLFGHQQIDSVTEPNVVVPADDMYFCSEVLECECSDGWDHCVIRLDRPVVGRTPIPIRREGMAAVGDSLVVVGHPTALPMKIADGGIVQSNESDAVWLEANLDTAPGNSGSMVVNTNTWEVEGILVRGTDHFIYTGTCVMSNHVPDSGNMSGFMRFVEVTRSANFAQFVPALVTSKGEIVFTKSNINCDDDYRIEIRDIDLAGSGQHTVEVVTSGGDAESVLLYESGPSTGIFGGSIASSTDPPVTGDNQLQVADGETVTVTYQDADDGSGSPAVVVENANVDCVEPLVYNVAVDTVCGTSATITFATDELATGRVEMGTDCGSIIHSVQGGKLTSHTVVVSGLSPSTVYRYRIVATDLAGNQTIDDNGGACYELSTTDQADYFTQQFTIANDLSGYTIHFEPDGSDDYYTACREPATEFPTDPAGGTVLNLNYNNTRPVSLTGNKQVSLYGQQYSGMYVCSNGFITFGFTSTSNDESIAGHFASGPRIDVCWDAFDLSSQGTASYKQLNDRLVVTWENVPQLWSEDSNSFQVEMFFNGDITITLLDMAIHDGLVGLSRGDGLPADFIESDMSEYIACVPCCVGMTGNVDNDPDDQVSLGDLTALIDHLFISLAPLKCPEEADMDGSEAGVISLGDLTALIDHLFISLDPLPDCP